MRKISAVALLWTYLFAGQSSAHAEFDLQAEIRAAPPRSTVEVPAGIHRGNFVVDRPLELRGAPGAVLDGQGKGSVLRVASAGVKLSDLTVQNSGFSLGDEHSGIDVEDAPGTVIERVVLRDVLFGIRIMASPGSRIENCTISGKDLDLGRRGDGVKIWYSPDTVVSKSRIHDLRDTVIWYSERCRITENSIRRNRYGLHYMYSHNNRADNNDISDSSVGIYNMYSTDLLVSGNLLAGNRGPSGYGFAAKESNELRIVNNRMINNRVGIHIDNSPINPPATMEQRTLFAENLIAYNDIGVEFVGPGEWAFIEENDIRENWQQVRTPGTTQLRAVWRGNYWSDYAGIDLEKSGFGSNPYRSISLADSLLDKSEAMQMFRFSPAMLALQFAERAFPWLQPRPRFVDPRPKMQPRFALSERNPAGGAAVRGFATGAGLILFAAALFRAFRL